MADKDKGWHSVGSEFDYQKSYVTREIQSNPPVSKNYYTLSFTIDFPHEQDIFYIAMNYPYTYTKMNHFIDRLGIHRLDLYSFSYPAKSINKFYATQFPTTRFLF
jgi:hypothetical protein